MENKILLKYKNDFSETKIITLQSILKLILIFRNIKFREFNLQKGEFMTKVLKLALASMVCATLGMAYSTDGALSVTATGYKTAKKVPVGASFTAVKFDYKSNKDFAAFLKSMNVTINALSVTVSPTDPLIEQKNKNLMVLFQENMGAKTSTIMAKIVDVKGDDKKGMLDISITMNKVTKVVPFNYMVQDGKLMAESSIDMMDFMMNESFASFVKAVGPLHEGKTFTEVGLKFALPISNDMM